MRVTYASSPVDIDTWHAKARHDVNICHLDKWHAPISCDRWLGVPFVKMRRGGIRPGCWYSCAPSKGFFRAGQTSPLPGLPVVTAAFLPHGYTVGYRTSPAARARFGLPALQNASLDVKLVSDGKRSVRGPGIENCIVLEAWDVQR